MRTILIAVGHAVLALTLTAGCGSSASFAAHGRAEVVASFFPLAEAAQQVGGSHVHVSNLTPPGVEPHDLEPTSRQVDRILSADLVIDMGRGFQPSVEEVARTRSSRTRLSVLTAFRLHGSDAHVWLDPVRMRQIVDLVADRLASLDPAHASDYRRRADSYDAELAALDADFAAGLQTCRSRVIVTSHEAFGYLAERYHLDQESIAGVDPQQEPDPRRLAQLADLVRREGVTTVFTEALVSPKVAETLAHEAHVTTAVLDPLESLRKGATGYVGVMRDNLTRLRKALGCS